MDEESWVSGESHRPACRSVPKQICPSDYVAAACVARGASRGNGWRQVPYSWLARHDRQDAPDDLRQPTSLFGDWLVHPLSQALLDFFELYPRAITSAPPMKEEVTPPRLPAYEGESQEPKGLRLCEPSPSASVRRVAAKLDQSGLVRM